MVKKKKRKGICANLMLVLLAGFWTHLIPPPISFPIVTNPAQISRMFQTLFISGRTNKIPIINRTYSTPGSKERRKEKKEKVRRTEKKEYQRKKKNPKSFYSLQRQAHSSKKAAFCRSACFL
jgi:hypothetical protein